MRTILIRLGLTLAGLLALAVAGIGAGYLLTRGTYTVPPTVTQDPTLPHVTIDGVTFHAEQFGNPTRPVVIVVHGGPGGDYQSLLSLKELADHSSVVFYDQRGAGLSPRVDPTELSWESSIADLDRIVGHYGQGRPVALVGHSWGAMLVASYLGRHPERATKAVLAEPGALTNAAFARWFELQRSIQGPDYLWRALVAGFESAHVRGPDPQAAEDYVNGTMAHYWLNLPANPYRCPDAPASPPPTRWGAQAYNRIFGSRPDIGYIAEQAPNFAGPVLFVASECNHWLGEALQREHMGLFRNARLVVIPGVGHNMFAEAPAASIPPVRAFLNE